MKIHQREPRFSMRRTDGWTGGWIGRTDTTKITVAFLNFANSPKNSLSFTSYLRGNILLLHFTHVRKKAAFNIRPVLNRKNAVCGNIRAGLNLRQCRRLHCVAQYVGVGWGWGLKSLIVFRVFSQVFYI
jgi:hypothetical protein